MIRTTKLGYSKKGVSSFFLGLFILAATACSPFARDVAFAEINDFSELELQCESTVRIVGYYDDRDLPLLHANREDCFSDDVNYQDAVLLAFGKDGFAADGVKNVRLGSKIVVEGVARCYREDELAVYRVELEQAEVLQLFAEAKGQ